MQNATSNKQPHKSNVSHNNKGQPSAIQTFTPGHGQHPSGAPFSPQSSTGQVFPDIPMAWFYPSSNVLLGGYQQLPGQAQGSDETNSAINMVLPDNVTEAQVLGGIGCEASAHAFLNEERDESIRASHMNTWVHHLEQRGDIAWPPRGQH